MSVPCQLHNSSASLRRLRPWHWEISDHCGRISGQVGYHDKPQVGIVSAESDASTSALGFCTSCGVLFCQYGSMLSIHRPCIPRSTRRTLLNAANISLDEAITQNVSRRWWGTHLSIASRHSRIGSVAAAAVSKKFRGGGGAAGIRTRSSDCWCRPVGPDSQEQPCWGECSPIQAHYLACN